MSEFLNDRRQRVRLDGKVSASVDVVLGVARGTVLRPLLFILHAFELIYIFGDHIVCYTYNTTSEGIAQLGIGSIQLLVFEMAHEAQP